MILEEECGQQCCGLKDIFEKVAQGFTTASPLLFSVNPLVSFHVKSHTNHILLTVLKDGTPCEEQRIGFDHLYESLPT